MSRNGFKRIVSVLCCVILCFGLVSCGANDSNYTKQTQENLVEEDTHADSAARDTIIADTNTEDANTSKEDKSLKNSSEESVNKDGDSNEKAQKQAELEGNSKKSDKEEAVSLNMKNKTVLSENDKKQVSAEKSKNTSSKDEKQVSAEKSKNTSSKNEKQVSAEKSKNASSKNGKKQASTGNTTSNKSQSAKKQADTSAKKSSSNVATSSASVSTTQTEEVGERYVTKSDGSDTKQDEYQTSPVPQGQQNPVEPQDVTVDKKVSATCSIEVNCATIKKNMDKLTKAKSSLVPDNGIIYKNDSAVFYEGESVADVLKRELKENKIHFEFTSTPGFNTDYIEGIGNLYEFDCGELSGWTYCVNGWFPNYGCSRYVVTQGDKIIWYYTCDLGKDVGGGVQNSTSASTTK